MHYGLWSIYEENTILTDKQILAAEIRREIALKEQENLHLQIENSKQIAQYMSTKYTNQQLYSWMIGQVSSVYFQTYKMAYDLAKQAERAFRFELGIETSNYIQFGYWDNLKKGLLSGEKLYHDLQRLDIAYLEKNKREYEITKHISLSMVNSTALLSLKETGVCEFEIPELLFDLDYAGQYFRRIKSVSITIPCIVGPYTSVLAKLSLLKNRIRKNEIVRLLMPIPALKMLILYTIWWECNPWQPVRHRETAACSN